LSRSPAAQRIGELAVQSGLLLSHFEHRQDLELPEDWEPVGRPDLGMPQGWRGGVLPETKYRSFRHDRIIGSFHPTHRAKWTAHELCHGLVGFAWHPGCSRFFQALAARLSEALPVALYYFFDEAGLRRCAAHDGGGPLYGMFCRGCEEAAERGTVNDPEASKWMIRGRSFVERELDAVRRSLHLGRMVPHRHHSLELSSDGLGYAAAHGPRMDSPEFARFVDLFFAEGEAWFSSIEGLQDRVETLTEDLCGGASARPWHTGRWMWIRQDLGWRLLQIRAECGGALLGILDELIEGLAAAESEACIRQTILDYDVLWSEWILPPSERVFALGYALPEGRGRAMQQLEDGIRSALPVTAQLLGESLSAHVDAFARQDLPRRRPLGRRFAESLVPGSALAELAALEAALSHADPADLEAATLRGEGEPPYRLRQGLELISSSYSVDLALDPEWRAAPSLPPARALPLHLLIFREPDGEVQVLEVMAETLAALRELRDGTGRPDWPADSLHELRHWGVLISAQT
jgi:hypothetical protein